MQTGVPGLLLGISNKQFMISKLYSPLSINGLDLIRLTFVETFFPINTVSCLSVLAKIYPAVYATQIILDANVYCLVT